MGAMRFDTCNFILFSYLCLGVRAQDPIRPYPLPDAYLKSTNLLNHTQYLTGIDDPQLYLDNIPFIDVPDQSIQDVYYYRSSVVKRHLKWGHEGHGMSESLVPVMRVY